MNKIKVFIDGQAGTTGLQLKSKLVNHPGVNLLEIDEDKRKDATERQRLMNDSDVVFLCLPDAAAIEAVKLVTNDKTVIIDASTAHRTSDGWTYGFPELSEKHYENIKNAKRIANPGCHASGFIALIKPLVEKGLLSKDVKLTCFSVTGYTGGGKKMIEGYESEDRSNLLDAPRQYALTQNHKHLPEMSKISGLNNLPIFCPIVSDYARGMEVTVPLFVSDVNGTIDDVKQALKEYYTGKIVRYTEESEEGFLSANALSGKDGMEVSVFGNEDRILLVSRFDNLGKGASGAAIQNMNILLGVDETLGLDL